MPAGDPGRLSDEPVARGTARERASALPGETWRSHMVGTGNGSGPGGGIGGGTGSGMGAGSGHGGVGSGSGAGPGFGSGIEPTTSRAQAASVEPPLLRCRPEPRKAGGAAGFVEEGVGAGLVFVTVDHAGGLPRLDPAETSPGQSAGARLKRPAVGTRRRRWSHRLEVSLEGRATLAS